MAATVQYQYATKPGQWTNVTESEVRSLIANRYTQTHLTFLTRQLERGYTVELDSIGVKAIRLVQPKA